MRGPLHQFVISQLQACKGDWPRVVEECGIPMSTLARIASGETPDPRISKIEKLATYFRGGIKQANGGGSARRAVPD